MRRGARPCWHPPDLPPLLRHGGPSSAKPRSARRCHMPQTESTAWSAEAIGTAIDEFDADIAIRAGDRRHWPQSRCRCHRGRCQGPARPPRRHRCACPHRELSAAGIVNADTFESATSRPHSRHHAICFAAQHRGMNLMTGSPTTWRLPERRGDRLQHSHDYLRSHRRHLEGARAGAGRPGHSTLKVFMTYDLLQVGNEKLLDILLAARKQALVCVHAENHGMISWMASVSSRRVNGAEVPRHQPPARFGGQGHQPPDHLRRVHRSADHDLPRLDGRRHGRHPPRARARLKVSPKPVRNICS